MIKEEEKKDRNKCRNLDMRDHFGTFTALLHGTSAVTSRCLG